MNESENGNEKNCDGSNAKTLGEMVAMADAARLLRKPEFFRLFLDAVRMAGLVGEENNALVVYVVGTSRLLARPINLFIKGHSSSGKNFLANSVLRFFPKEEVVEITSSSGASWNYQGNNLEHRIVYIQEQNKAAGNIHPARLLISEKEIVRMVTVRSGAGFTTKREVTRGPVACISTTTKERLEIDDETRNISIWTDPSADQTKRIIQSQLQPTQGITAVNLTAWHGAQYLFAERAKLPIGMGEWANQLVNEVWTGDVRIRRYFPSLLEACKTVCLIRSFRFDDDKIANAGKLTVHYSDFAIATLIFDNAFSQSLSYGDGEERELHRVLATVSERKNGQGVDATEFAKELGISKDRAYVRLREAADKGSIRRANEPQHSNRKTFLPAERVHMLPDPGELFRRLCPGRRVRFVHPITGDWVEYKS